MRRRHDSSPIIHHQCFSGLGAEEEEEAEEGEESINPRPCRSALSDGHRVSPIVHHG
jgi:hypothetical protein